MLGKALTTAVLLAATLAAAPQAQAGPTLSATIVIESANTTLVTRQNGYRHHKRHWNKRPEHRRGFARHHARHHAAPARRHFAGHHRPSRHARAGGRWFGHGHRAAHRSVNHGRRSRN